MTVMLQAGSFADARLLCHAKERRCHASRVRLVLRVALQQSRRAAHAAEPRHGPRQALQAMRRCFVGGGEVNPPCPPVGVAQLLEPRRGGRPRCEQCIDTGVQLRDAGAQLGPQRLARLLAPLLTPQGPCPPGRGRRAVRRHGRRRRWHVQRECELVGDDVPPGRILVCLLQHGTPSGCIGGVAPKTRRRARLERVAVPSGAVRQDEARGVVSGRMRCTRIRAAHLAVCVPRPACVWRRPQPPATQLHQPRDVSCAHAARRHDAHAGHVQLYEVLARMHHDVRAPRYSPHTPRHDAVGDILPRVLYAEQHHMAAACADQEPGRRSRVWLPCETRAVPRHVVVVTQAGHVDVAQTRRARIQTHAASCIDRR
mgnify:FL=1